jgi:hypothetical protein
MACLQLTDGGFVLFKPQFIVTICEARSDTSPVTAGLALVLTTCTAVAAMA